MSQYDLFVFAGEVSGDLHGEELLKALYAQNPELKIMGVGGPKMRATGMSCTMPMEKFQVMGFVDVFLALPKLIKQFYAVGRSILEAQPKAVLFIDYPGFNLRMAKFLRKKGYRGKLIHYICPSVWAWGKKRIEQMASTLDLLLAILPFEPSYFSHTTLQVEFVGHPLIKKIPHVAQINASCTQVALFPGSRYKEIIRNLPLQLRVAKRLQAEHPELNFALSISQPRFTPLIESIIEKENIHVALIPPEKTYQLMQSSYFAIAKSGTVTLELALHGVPTIVMYAVSFLDVIITKHILRILLPFYCLVNIISNKEVFPELIGPNLTEESLYNASKKLLETPSLWENCRQECIALRTLLQNKNASHVAAAKILDTLC
jgi:lipid-A-disaccharide synthase